MISFFTKFFRKDNEETKMEIDPIVQMSTEFPEVDITRAMKDFCTNYTFRSREIFWNVFLYHVLVHSLAMYQFDAGALRDKNSWLGVEPQPKAKKKFDDELDAITLRKQTIWTIDLHPYWRRSPGFEPAPSRS